MGDFFKSVRSLAISLLCLRISFLDWLNSSEPISPLPIPDFTTRDEIFTANTTSVCLGITSKFSGVELQEEKITITIDIARKLNLFMAIKFSEV